MQLAIKTAESTAANQGRITAPSGMRPRGRAHAPAVHRYLRRSIEAHLARRRQPFELGEAVARAVGACARQAGDGAALEADLLAPLHAVGDRRIIARAFEALIASVISAAGAGRAVSCRLRLEGCEAVLVIAAQSPRRPAPRRAMRQQQGHPGAPAPRSTPLPADGAPDAMSTVAAPDAMSTVAARLAIEAHGGRVAEPVGKGGDAGLEIRLPARLL